MRIALIALLSFSCLTGSRAADDPRASQLTFQPWSKTCLGRSDCFVGSDVRGACVPSGGGVVIHTVNGRAKGLSAFVGTKLTLDGNIRVQIDQDQPVFVPAPNCYASGCNGNLEIGDEFVERMKRSSDIAIEATTTAHRKITLSFSLAGFAESFDGPGTEPKVIEVIGLSKEMKERLEKAEREKPPSCKE
jgi:invasion protein IalB